MIVHGNIESGTDIEIMGTVMGEVTSEGRIYVSGTVTGNISGKNVTICTKEVNANVIAIERVSIERDTVINGNVTADFLIVNGNVNGNIKANKELVVMAGATIKGDIEAQTMEVNRGAVINGKVSFQVNQEEANS